MDPFLDLIRLLRPRATLWGGLDAFGRWGLSFRSRNDLLFCWLAQGECLLLCPHSEPVALQANDFALIRASTSFVIASDSSVKPLDSETAVAASTSTRLRLGNGTDSPVSLTGGRFVFDTANENLLTGLLPQLVHIKASDTSAFRVRTLLQMNEMEYLNPGAGSDFITSRLMELILVEVLRNQSIWNNRQSSGMLAGLGDPVTSRALAVMHGDAAHDWTVAELARVVAVSRSAFAARFSKIVGLGPIEYLQSWRLALAKDELRYGKRTISEIAFLVGFQSASAFSTAFTRSVGCSPKRFAESSQP